MESVLQLNFSYEPLAVVDLHRAVRLLFQGKAEIVVGKLERVLHSAGGDFAFPLPSVIRMLYYIRHRRKAVTLTKRNVILRDDGRCGYCGIEGAETVDHIFPKSRGGISSWTNLVACCEPCNARKKNRTPEEAKMTLRRRPFAPRYIPWVTVKRHVKTPAEWRKFLFYEVGIEERVGQ